MSNWNPKSLRPTDPNPMFEISEEVNVEVINKGPMQQQRESDGSPYTRHGATGLKPPGADLYLDNTTDVAEKSFAAAEPTPDEVVKAYMAPDKEKEDEEKAIGGASSSSALPATPAEKLASPVKLK